ncbi:uncharacterized protein LOC117653586 [Thrips palmi]|uniref:Uncharacterized protein LOC117653586 n=1 Tax=Thrips palmi TaxID=161013 RepID=A0A6P9AB03_THRPL|nr:uncharacterized protein LOC117653586 [Thrips palmi]
MRETSLRKITTLRLDLNPWEIGAVTRTLNSLRSLEALHLPSGTIFCSSWQAVDLSRLNKIFLYGSGYSQSDVTTLIKKRWPHVTYRLFPLIDRRHRDFLLL